MSSSSSSSFVVLCALLVTAAWASIVDPPQNTAVEFGPAVVLTCVASSLTSRVEWTEFVTTPGGAIISDGSVILGGHPNSARYSILTDGTGLRFDLRISPTTLEDGGNYRCSDVSDASPPAYAQLVTLGGPPACLTNIANDGYVREDQYYSAECAVEYRGIASPQMHWTGPEVFHATMTTTNTTVWSGMNVNMTRAMDSQYFEVLTNFTQPGFIQPDSATNVPTWSYTYRTPSLKVEWSPKNMYVTPAQSVYEVGDTIECHADAKPLATYFWQNLENNDRWLGPILDLTDELVGTNRMRCNAENNITGTLYTNDYFMDLTVVPRTTTTITTRSTSTTEPPPVEGPCADLSGRWTASTPHLMDMCIDVDNANYGRIVGIVRNASDPYFIEVRGRVLPYKFNQIGFTGVWPVNIGTMTFIGNCRRCSDGVEKMQLNGIVRKVTDNPSCEDPGPSTTFDTYVFQRTGEQACRRLIDRHLKGQ